MTEHLLSFKKDLRLQSNSEEHRHNCEVRYCIKLPLQERRKYLSKVEDVRGIEERKKLENSLFLLWQKRKNGVK